MRATWNIDGDRVVMYGSSDGGAALFFQAMRTPVRWAGYCGHVAPPDRLVRADFRPDGQMHVSNLKGQRFHLGYGEKDKKVPLRYLEKYMALFEEAGTQIDWYVLPGQGHSLRLPAEKENELGNFLFRTVRESSPSKLSWATERTDRYARRQWLVIDELEAAERSHKVDESELLPRWGTRVQMHGKTSPRLPWGRVEAERTGNHIRVSTRRVVEFRVLLSADDFDFEQPIVIEVDGRERFNQLVEPSVTCLLEWAAIDDDRTRLYAAEVSLRP